MGRCAAFPVRSPSTGWRNGPWARASSKPARGLGLLSGGERIVTDRLHGHILALLLGIPHIVLDNDYGKLAAYIRVWTQASPLVTAAASAREAAGMLAT